LIYLEELLAEAPCNEFDDESRMMVVHRERVKIEHRHFKDVLEYFDEGDVFIMNIRRFSLLAYMEIREKPGAKIEVFL